LLQRSNHALVPAPCHQTKHAQSNRDRSNEQVGKSLRSATGSKPMSDRKEGALFGQYDYEEGREPCQARLAGPQSTPTPRHCVDTKIVRIAAGFCRKERLPEGTKFCHRRLSRRLLSQKGRRRWPAEVRGVCARKPGISGKARTARLAIAAAVNAFSYQSV
jgi:hypothetical protein